MGAEKFNHSQEITMQQTNYSWQDFEDHDEETLSLCDLVVSSDANEYWNNDFSKEDHDDHQSNNNGDFFEFFSEDFPAEAPRRNLEEKNNIVFCGKIIPFKDQLQPRIEDKQSQSLTTGKFQQENDEKKKKISGNNFPWKISHSFNKSRTFPSSSSKGSQRKSLNKSLSMPAAADSKNNSGKYGSSDQSKKLGHEKKFDFSVKKVDILATPVKSRWYLFAFGVGRFPMEIELKDMKMRQSRKNKAMKCQAPEGGGGGGGGERPENVKGGKERRRSANGLWRLLKVLGCKRKVTNAGVVQASFGCNEHV